MKKTTFFLLLSFLLISSVHAASVKENISDVQSSTPVGTPAAPSGYDQKGFVGEILSGIFTDAGSDTGKIKSEFVNAFHTIAGILDNVPKWDGTSFQVGTIWDKGGNIGIGNPNPSRKLDVVGDINFTGDIYQDGVLFSGESLWTESGTNIYRPAGRVGIGTSSPAQQLHTAGTARFDGGVQVDGTRAISATNYIHTAQSTTTNRYGFFEVRNDDGQRGGAFGYGNGGDQISLFMDEATKLNITGGDVGIGVNDPGAKLHVDGNIISDNPTAGNHVTTMSYVDNRISTEIADAAKFVDGTDTRDAVYTGRRVGIGTTAPEQQLHTTGTVRFDGGVQVDGTRAISATNYIHTAQSTTTNRYGFFEVRNDDGQRGGAFGYGNGGDQISLFMDEATKLNITGGDVGIGVNNPGAKLHVDGNIISDNPTANNHVTTKNYVDTEIANISSGDTFPTCTNGQILKHNGTQFVCANESTGGGSGSGGPQAIEYGECVALGAGESTGYVNGLDGGTRNPNQTWNAQCPVDHVIVGIWDDNDGFEDIDDVKCCKLKGGETGSTPTLPTCSSGQILKHNGIEFVCAVDNSASGSSSLGCEIQYRWQDDNGAHEWRSTGKTNGTNSWSEGAWSINNTEHQTPCGTRNPSGGCGIQMRIRCN